MSGAREEKPQVTLLCSDPAHPVNAWLERWLEANREAADIRILRDVADLEGGDFLFLISCHQIVKARHRDLFRHTLVLHASNLPQGRGWSPHVWAVVEGADHLTLSLLEAGEGVDTGRIWHQAIIPLEGTELHDEIHAKLFDAELSLMDWALANCDTATPREQEGEPSYYPRRTPADSRIDPARSLADSFDLLRIADPDRYPAFFSHRGATYRLRLERFEPPE